MTPVRQTPLTPAEEPRVRRTWLALRDALDCPDEENLRRLTKELQRAAEEERGEAN